MKTNSLALGPYEKECKERSKFWTGFWESIYSKDCPKAPRREGNLHHEAERSLEAVECERSQGCKVNGEGVHVWSIPWSMVFNNRVLFFLSLTSGYRHTAISIFPLILHSAICHLLIPRISLTLLSGKRQLSVWNLVVLHNLVRTYFPHF